MVQDGRVASKLVGKPWEGMEGMGWDGLAGTAGGVGQIVGVLRYR